jgi:hypothetical protein
VGGEVLELQAVVFQQQQEEGGERHPEATEEVGNEQDELPRTESAKGRGTGANSRAAVRIVHPISLRTFSRLSSFWKRLGLPRAISSEGAAARGGEGLGGAGKGSKSRVAGGASDGCCGRMEGFVRVALASSQETLMNTP